MDEGPDALKAALTEPSETRPCPAITSTKGVTRRIYIQQGRLISYCVEESGISAFAATTSAKVTFPTVTTTFLTHSTTADTTSKGRDRKAESLTSETKLLEPTPSASICLSGTTALTISSCGKAAFRHGELAILADKHASLSVGGDTKAARTDVSATVGRAGHIEGLTLDEDRRTKATFFPTASVSGTPDGATEGSGQEALTFVCRKARRASTAVPKTGGPSHAATSLSVIDKRGDKAASLCAYGTEAAFATTPQRPLKAKDCRTHRRTV